MHVCGHFLSLRLSLLKTRFYWISHTEQKGEKEIWENTDVFRLKFHSPHKCVDVAVHKYTCQSMFSAPSCASRSSSTQTCGCILFLAFHTQASLH